MRPANQVTAIADIAAGVAAGLALSGGLVPDFSLELPWLHLVLLAISTFALYGGGIVFNDIFDLPIDRVERPERPLPSGAVRLMQAVRFGAGLLFLGIILAFMVNAYAGWIAVAVAVLALLYDKYGKHHPVFGPVNMSLCRGANLLLGVSAFPEALSSAYVLAILPLIYISSITLISRGEVGGGNKSHLRLAVAGYGAVVLILLLLGQFFPYKILHSLPFVGAFAYFVFPPLFRALRTLAAGDIRKAVKAGVISLILLDAALAAGFMHLLYGLMVTALLPISMRLGKYFAVT